MTVNLRPYQQKAVDDLRAAFAAGKKAPLLVMPTGSGKTYTYSAISEGAARRGNRILILEHRRELIRQASCSLATLGVRHRIIAPASKIADIRLAHVERLGWPMVDQKAHVAVASVQTLIRRLDWLAEFDPDLIIVDEGDLGVAGSWLKIYEAVPRAKRLGVTASPERTDGVGMDTVYDHMVLGPTMRELIELGALCRPKVFAPPCVVDLAKVAHSGGEFDASAAAELLDRPSVTGDAVEHYRKLAHERPAIVFCASVQHAEHVAEDFRAAGYRFEVVTGETDDDLRDDRIFGLASGKYHGIVTVDVVSRGTDIPVAEVAILLRPTESLALYLQQVGRVLRPAEGKEYGLVLDHVGNVGRHGLPHRDREWTLEGRQKGTKAKPEEGDVPSVMRCPKCHHTHEPEPKCPECGHVYDIQVRKITQVDGTLGEVPDDTDQAPPKIQTGRIRTAEQAAAAGMSMGRWRNIERARLERERLSNELRAMLTRAGEKMAERDIQAMKPKQLNAEIQRLGELLFMQTAVDHQPEFAGFELA